MSETGMIQIDNITKVFEGKRGKVIANDGISLSVNHGEIVGLLGHNGAGKTTLVNQMLGLLKPTSGDITIMGQMRGGKEREMQAEAMRLFEALDITEWMNKECNQLSGGVKRLTAFCMAVVHSKQVIILDEPTNDVDPVRRRYLWSEIKKLTQRGRGVILVTHNVAEAEHVVDKVAILHLAIDWVREQIERKTVYDYTLSESTLEDIYVKLTTEKEGQIHDLNLAI